MKGRGFIAFLIVGLISVLVVGAALAFNMGNADGVWGYIDGVIEDSGQSVEGAECSNWGTGTANADGDITIQANISSWNPNIQTGSNTDENQVRYGLPDSQVCSTNTTYYNEQSGLGFFGNDDIGTGLAKGDEFWIGRLTHYNKPIGLTDIGGGDRNFLEYADIFLTISGLQCPGGANPDGGVTTMTFSYRVNFEETSNNGTGSFCGNHNYNRVYNCPYTVGNDDFCPYQDQGVNSNGCADRVMVSSAPPAQSFTCTEGLSTDGIYTITLLGFQSANAYDACATQVFNENLITDEFITQEQANTHVCLWAQISEFEPTAVTLKDFNAEALDDAVDLYWTTTSELNTLGFNLYRAVSEDGERAQINDGLIISDMVPGSLGGEHYSFKDFDALPAGTYFYWLEEVEIDSSTNLYGPTQAIVD